MLHDIPQRRLDKLASWDFDTIGFDQATGGKSLSILAMLLLEEKLGLEPSKMFNWDNVTMQACKKGRRGAVLALSLPVSNIDAQHIAKHDSSLTYSAA